MDSLDLPQSVYLCSNCGAEDGDAVMCGCPVDALACVPTLTYRDFEAHLSTLPHPQPDPFVVWDLLETKTGNEAANRQAIDNAIREVGR